MSRTIKVFPNSVEEQDLMELMKEFRFEVVARLGSIFGSIYNEYVISDVDFNTHKDQIEKIIYRYKKGEIKVSFKDKVKSFFSREDVLVGTLGTILIGCLGVISYVSYKEGFDAANAVTDEMIDEAAKQGWNEAMELVHSNTDSIIHKAYDIANDTFHDVICDKVPEAAALIDKYCENHDDFIICIGDAVVDYTKGTLRLK